MKVCVYSIFVNFYLSFNVFIIIHWFTMKLVFNRLLILFHIALYCLAILYYEIKIHAFLSLKCLISPFIWGSLIHSGLVWSFIYSKKYLKETFLPYKSLLDITILWTFTLSMSIKSFCLCFVLFSYNVKQKRWKLFLLIFLLSDKVFVISFYIYTMKRFYNNSLFYLNINFSLY